MTSNEKQKVKRTLQGKVVSNKMDKTIVVLVERKVKHSVTGKYIRRSSKIHAHDALNVGKIGDVVTIAEGRAVSKTKHWVLSTVVGK